MDTSEKRRYSADEVDLLLTNAQLRDELEPYRDESIESDSVSQMPLRMENEYLESMLAWERAPALPISNWFSPSLKLPAPETLTDSEVSDLLTKTIVQLHSQRVVLRYTDHLSDRDLYKVVYRDILPCCEKKVEIEGKNLEWRCIEDSDTWLRYYATAVDRRRFQEEHGVELPPAETPAHTRNLPA